MCLRFRLTMKKFLSFLGGGLFNNKKPASASSLLPPAGAIHESTEKDVEARVTWFSPSLQVQRHLKVIEILQEVQPTQVNCSLS